MSHIYELNNQSNSQGNTHIDYEKELNEEQYKAVICKNKASMVIAGAGSGKTRTLTYRVAYLLENGIKPENILLLTFTNKASKEMLDRIQSLVPYDADEIWGGTFHSIGNRILRRHAKDLGLNHNFSILDTEDQKDLISSVISQSKIDTKSTKFPKPDVLSSIFSFSLNTYTKIQNVLSERFPYFEDVYEKILKLSKLYLDKKLETNSVDFDDLLYLTVKLLKENEHICQYYQSKFQYILVDEYQDTNKIQAELIDILGKRGSNIMVVGDDAQSIYSWRGANFKNIIDFPDKYPDTSIYKIETNYRSTPEILKIANASISSNTAQYKKNLSSIRESLQDAKPALVPLTEPLTQAKFIAQRILDLNDEGVDFKEMAVLYRAHFHSLEIQLELTNRGIPFKITSGLRFFEQAHIKDITAFIKLVVNLTDEISFYRIVKMIPGVGAKTAEKLWIHWKKLLNDGRDIFKMDKPFSSFMLKMPAPKKSLKTWQQIAYTFDGLIENGAYIKPDKMVKVIMDGVYNDILKSKFANYDTRKQDIQQLAYYSKQFKDIGEFLSELSLLTGVDTGVNEKAQDTNVVTLSSIHQAKGLEWHTVFLVWLTEGMFPSRRIIENDDIDALEEERRLFYVSVTRAKDELYLTYPQTWPKAWGGDMFQRPSRFLDEIPPDLIEDWQVNTRR